MINLELNGRELWGGTKVCHLLLHSQWVRMASVGELCHGLRHAYSVAGIQLCELNTVVFWLSWRTRERNRFSNTPSLKTALDYTLRKPKTKTTCNLCTGLAVTVFANDHGLKGI